MLRSRRFPFLIVHDPFAGDVAAPMMMDWSENAISLAMSADHVGLRSSAFSFLRSRCRGQCMLEMQAHPGGGLAEIAGYDRLDDRDVLAAPILDATTVEVAAEFQQPPQPVLVLDRLNEEGVAAKFSAHFVKCRVGLEQLRTGDRGDVGMRNEIQMLQAHSLDGGEIRLECRQQEAGGLEREAKFVAAFQRNHGIERRKKGPS